MRRRYKLVELVNVKVSGNIENIEIGSEDIRGVLSDEYSAYTDQ